MSEKKGTVAEFIEAEKVSHGDELFIYPITDIVKEVSPMFSGEYIEDYVEILGTEYEVRYYYYLEKGYYGRRSAGMQLEPDIPARVTWTHTVIKIGGDWIQIPVYQGLLDKLADKILEDL